MKGVGQSPRPCVAGVVSPSPLRESLRVLRPKNRCQRRSRAFRRPVRSRWSTTIAAQAADHLWGWHRGFLVTLDHIAYRTALLRTAHSQRRACIGKRGADLLITVETPRWRRSSPGTWRRAGRLRLAERPRHVRAPRDSHTHSPQPTLGRRYRRVSAALGP